MEAIDYAHADPEAGLPSPSWHWWKAAREALAAAQEDRTDGSRRPGSGTKVNPKE